MKPYPYYTDSDDEIREYARKNCERFPVVYVPLSSTDGKYYTAVINWYDGGVVTRTADASL